jgi:RND superfamily putative drug exporter
MAAIAIDATLVRLVLVPSLMALVGRWNWWVPGFLREFADRGVTFDEQDLVPELEELATA